MQTGSSLSKIILVTGAVVALLAIIAISLQREFTSQPKTRQFVVAVERQASVAAPPALTAEEETFAAALWPLHQSVVEPSSGRLTFAGLTYAIEDHDAQRLAATLAPLRKVFHDSRDQVAMIPVPASLRDVRDRYANMLSLYEQSASEMQQVERDGDQQHLIDAQIKSETAAEELVRLGDMLWPGEHKPN